MDVVPAALVCPVTPACSVGVLVLGLTPEGTSLHLKAALKNLSVPAWYMSVWFYGRIIVNVLIFKKKKKKPEP